MMKTLKRLQADTAGNFGMLTAILLFPLLGAAGLAIDYTAASDMKTQLQSAADAAAIGSVSEKSPAVIKAWTMTSNGTIAEGHDDAVELFRNNLAAGADGALGAVTAVVEKKGNAVISKVGYTAQVPTTFMRLFGMDTLPIAGEASAEIETKSSDYMDFYLLLDNTPSMGLGATSADITNMIKKAGCAFACHDMSAKGNDNYGIARKNNIKLRIDLVKEATLDLVDTAKRVQAGGGTYRMGVYSFGSANSIAPTIAEMSPLTTDLDGVKTKASLLDLMTVASHNDPAMGDMATDFRGAFNQINAKITTNGGDGKSAASPAKYVFFVSDGVNDGTLTKGQTCSQKTVNFNATQKNPSTGSKTLVRCQEPIDTSACETLKKRNIQVAVLYTTYLPVTSDSWYMSYVNPYNAPKADGSDTGTAAKMRACASPGLYFEVNPNTGATGISDAMKALFTKITTTPRITS